jgi:putative ABC transport system permease protein
VFSLLAFDGVGDVLKPLVLLVIVAAAKILIDLFFSSEMGLAMRATGSNPRMARAQGISTDRFTLWGLALSNALVALAGALFVQSQGGADISMGIGTIVIGLAAVIIGETILPARSLVITTAACIVGALLYRFFIALALNSDFIGLQAQDLNLVTAVLVAFALLFPPTSASRGCGRPSARRPSSPRRPDHVVSPRSRNHLQPRVADREPRAARPGPNHPDGSVRHRHRQQRRR